jgi:hypothetical protein
MPGPAVAHRGVLPPAPFCCCAFMISRASAPLPFAPFHAVDFGFDFLPRLVLLPPAFKSLLDAAWVLVVVLFVRVDRWRSDVKERSEASPLFSCSDEPVSVLAELSSGPNLAFGLPVPPVAPTSFCLANCIPLTFSRARCASFLSIKQRFRILRWCVN